jgi:hypothetical protein
MTAAAARRLACLVGCLAWVGVLGAQGLRTVDSVVVGTKGDEPAHLLSETGSVTGQTAGLAWRSATGSFGYSLRIYDDSPLTLVYRTADGDGSPEWFDVLLDGRKVSTVSRTGDEAKASEVTIRLPLADTAGQRSVVVTFSARPGSRTARVVEVKSVQEHLE